VTYRIICTNQEPVYLPTTHAHIVAVGTGTDPDHWSRKWTLAQVIAAIDSGDVFYTHGRYSNKTALVRVVRCEKCNNRIIRSAPDAVTDNNLDRLPQCG